MDTMALMEEEQKRAKVPARCAEFVLQVLRLGPCAACAVGGASVVFLCGPGARGCAPGHGRAAGDGDGHRCVAHGYRTTCTTGEEGGRGEGVLGAARSPFLRSSWWNYLVSGWKYCILCCFLLQVRMGLAAAGLPNPYGGQPKKTETAGEKTASSPWSCDALWNA